MDVWSRRGFFSFMMFVVTLLVYQLHRHTDLMNRSSWQSRKSLKTSQQQANVQIAIKPTDVYPVTTKTKQSAVKTSQVEPPNPNLFTEKSTIPEPPNHEPTVTEILEKRRERLLSYCNGRELIKPGNSSDTDVKLHFLYSFKKQFLYCSIPKVGCTMWKRIFQLISGMSDADNPYSIKHASTVKRYPNFSKLSFDVIHAFLDNSLKFMVVRDPFARLFSGFGNKLFEVQPEFWNSYGKIINERYRGNNTKSVRCGHDTTFPDFVKYIIWAERKNKHRDAHFKPMYDQCRPCQIKYDVIAKLETIKRDTLYVLEKLNMTHFRKLHDVMTHLEDVSEAESIKSVTSSMMTLLKRPSVKGCISMGEAYRRTWRSFQYRGLIGRNIRYPLTKTQEDDTDVAEITRIFLSAHELSGNRETRLKNRQLVLEEAYSLVPLQDLNSLSDIFYNDCQTFGYNCKPGYFFSNQKRKTNFLDVWSA